MGRTYGGGGLKSAGGSPVFFQEGQGSDVGILSFRAGDGDGPAGVAPDIDGGA